MSMMTEPNDAMFRLFHRYNRLVRRSLVQPLTCKTCANPYITGVATDGELLLKCFSCNSETRPGMETIGKVYAVVTEHFVDD